MENKNKIKVLHIVKWFYAGGAERILSSVLEHSDNNKFEHVIVSLSDQGERIEKIQDSLGIEYKAFNFERGKWNVKNYIKCFKFIKEKNPDIIKGWLPPGNIMAAFAGLIFRKTVIWGLHDSQPHRRYDKRLVFVSKFLVKKIVCCSDAVRKVCINVGYQKDKLEVFYNGTDTNYFNKIINARKSLCDELGINNKYTLIGFSAEYSGVKRHDNFLEAAKLFLKDYPNTYFILCGKNIDDNNLKLVHKITHLGIYENVKLLGIRNDMPTIFSALDISTLNSEHESFGLSISESMSCKTFCVATKTGVLPKLLKGVGFVIEVSTDPKILRNAWDQALKINTTKKQSMLNLGRKRIENEYSIRDTAKKYDRLFSAF